MIACIIALTFFLQPVAGAYASKQGDAEIVKNKESVDTTTSVQSGDPASLDAAVNDKSAPLETKALQNVEASQLSGETLVPYTEDKKSIGARSKVEPDPSTGALIYNYPIDVPPGRNGIQPNLKLTYNSQNADIMDVFGSGWSLNIPYIERVNKKGVEKLYTEDNFASSMSGELNKISTSSGATSSMGRLPDMIQKSKNKFCSLFDQSIKPASADDLENVEKRQKEAISGEVIAESDGSVKFGEPKESVDKKTRNSNKFVVGKTKDGNPINQVKIYKEDVNFFNPKTSQLEPIDTKLRDELDRWRMESAAYRAELSKFIGDKFLTFTNQGQELNFSLPQTERISQGELVVFDDDYSNKKVAYKDALGKGIDLEVSLDNEKMRKEAVIDNIQSLGDIEDKEFYDITFRLASNRIIDIKAGDKVLSNERVITTSDSVEVVDEQGVVSYIYAPIAEGSGKKNDGGEVSELQNVININIEYKLNDDGSITMTKKLPVAWLKSAKYPIRTDATVGYYPNTADGYIAKRVNNSDWNGTRNALVGDEASSSDQRVFVAGGYDVSGFYLIYRGFFSFDTSEIPDSATINGATFNFVSDLARPAQTPGVTATAFLTQNNQANVESLSTDDYDQLGGVSGGDILYGNINVDGFTYNSLSLNSGALGWVSKNGYTKLGLRSIADMNNIQIPTQYMYDYMPMNVYSSDYFGTNKDPYLEVNYYEISSSSPTELVVDSKTNNNNVGSVRPSFGAKYNCSNPSDQAANYEIQVSVSSSSWSSLIWDSGKTTLPTALVCGSSTPNIYYGSSTPLAIDGAKYYWRIKFWNNSDIEGAWSSGSDYFKMLATTDYGAKIDNGDFLKYQFVNGQYWIANDKNGVKYRFGYHEETRQDNSLSKDKVFKWMLDEVTDLNGNKIKYEYYKDEGQIYPNKIKYTGHGADDGNFEVDFIRESRGDTSISYRAGFKVKANYRIKEIQTKFNGNWVKKYAIGYTVGDNGLKSLINSILVTGQDEQGAVNSLPASTFSYQHKQASWATSTSWTIPEAFLTGSSNFDTGARFADVNGDGLVDIIKYDDYSSPAAYINTGSGWVASSTWNPPIRFIGYGGSDIGVRQVDVNGDGLVDIVKGGGSPKMVYLNNGSGWTASTTWVFPSDPAFSLTITSAQDGSRMADVNGDGLIDIIWSAIINYQPEKKVYINSGSGWIYNGSWQIPYELMFGSFNGNQLADANGDGLVDIIRGVSNDNIHYFVYLNKGDGTGWFESSYGSPGYYDVEYGHRLEDINGDGLVDSAILPAGGGQNKYVNLNNGMVQWGQVFAWNIYFGFSYSSGTYFVDVNGDSLTDVIRSKDGDRGVWLADPDKPDLLSMITMETGGSYRFTYKETPLQTSSGSLNNPKLQQPLTTLQTVVASDNNGNTGTTTYDYFGGEIYYNSAHDHKFAGFGRVETTDPYGNVTKTYYHQGNATASTTGEHDDHFSKIGRDYRKEIYDNTNHLYVKTISKWDKYALGDDRYFVKVAQTIESDYDGNSTHKDKATTYSYENTYGNLVTFQYWGEVIGSDNGVFFDTGTDLASSTISYITSSPNHLPGLKSGEILYDQSGNKVSESRYYYDNQPLGSATHGNLTKQEDWVSGSSYIDNEKSYNDYGQVTEEKDPRDKVTTYIYDSYSLYPATTTNALGQKTGILYDYSLGKPKQITDANNLTSQTVYDGLDRVIEERQPDLAASSTLVTKASYAYFVSTSTNYIVKTNYLNTATTTDTYNYLDGLGGEIQTRVRAAGVNNYSVADTLYDKQHRPYKKSLPYFSTGTSLTAATTSNFLYNVSSFDVLGRISTSVNSVGTTTTSYDDWKTTIADALGHVKDITNDAMGNLVKVDEHNGTSTYSTVYDYNLQSKLKKITDAQGNVRNFDYDGLGRLFYSEDLHAPGDGTFGALNYTYDNTGNTLSQTDAKNQVVNYSYDDLNRPLTEDFTGQAGVEIAYGYDNCQNGIGRLCVATSTSAVTRYSYNPLGLVETEAKIIGGSTFLTQYDYDRQGDQALITYPDSSQVKYQYNGGGQLETVQSKEPASQSFVSLIDSYEYNQLGQRVLEDYGNNTKSTLAYDPNQLYRLTGRKTVKEAAGGMQSQASMFVESNMSADPDIQEAGQAILNSANNEEVLAAGLGTAQSDGSVLLNQPQEEQSLKSFRGDTYLRGYRADGKAMYTARFYQEDVNYFDAIHSRMASIDTTVIDALAEFRMDKAPYQAHLAKTVGGSFLKFINQSQELNIAALSANQDASAGVINALSVDYPGRQVRYPDGLGRDIDLVISLDNQKLVKEAVIGNYKAMGNMKGKATFDIPFRITSNQTIDIKVDGQSLRAAKTITSESQAEIIDENGITTYILPPKAQDADGKIIGVDITYEVKADGLYLTKHLPADWLKSARYPVQTDAVLSVYSSAGDGELAYTEASDWSTARNASSATQVKATSTSGYLAKTEKDANGKYSVYKGVLQFYYNISMDAVVTSASLNVYGDAKEGSSTHAIVPVSFSPTVNGALSNGDFSRVGLIIGQTKSIGDFVANGYNTFPINSSNYSGLVWRGWHNFGFRMSNDYDNIAPIDSTGAKIYYSEESGTSKDPYLTIDYWVNRWPTAPTELQTEHMVNPVDLTDKTPEFSAIFNDINVGVDSAAKYQIQVSASSTNWSALVWDSAIRLLSKPVPVGSRSEDIAYAGALLPFDGRTYYWRIRFFDSQYLTGAWSTTTSAFAMADQEYLQNFEYEYSPIGNITRLTEYSANASSKAVVYGYDDLSRLISASSTEAANGQNYRQTYAYDAIGNIQNKSDIGNYTYAGDQGNNYANPHAATTIGSSTNIYDNNGNLSSDGQWTHTWDYRNRLIQSTKGTTSVRYAYDQDDTRISYFDGMATTTYANKYYSVVGASTTKNVYAGDQLVATIESNGSTTQTYFIHSDHLGGSNVVTDSNGDVAQLLDYYPYGGIRLNESSAGIDEKRKFTGHEYDAETGLNYMVARYYDGKIGRFNSIDPVYNAMGNEAMIKSKTGMKIQQLLENPQALNSYSYAINNPLTIYDPNGEWFREFFTGQQSWSSFQLELGDAAQTLYDTSAAGRTIMNHPYASGLAIGAGGGLAAQGAAAGLTYLSINYAGGIGTACLIGCNSVVQKAPGYAQQGYKSFQAFKNAVGRADPSGQNARQWHHIVEQTDKNISRFGQEALQNGKNIVNISTQLHQKISGYYSSIDPSVTGSATMRVRDWVSQQSFSEQAKIGAKILSDFASKK